ncbi:hypothetical protein [Sporisorium scitamineum]|uniref:dUTP diphosphatase n=1 Tax=Sporisorium scitamineum TaxID=49012 RepID=A0A0F7SDI1_9BASI|nr:hypothetical protein [Sporisorium scitamineum]
MTVDIPTTAPAETRPSKITKLTHTSEIAMSAPSSSSALRLLVQRHPAHPLAKLPTRGSALAAGYDLYSAEKVVLPRGGRKVIQTGIFNEGDRIAQLIIEKISTPEVQEVESLDETLRGAGGFGSTGGFGAAASAADATAAAVAADLPAEVNTSSS